MIPNRDPSAWQICPHCTSDVTKAIVRGDTECPVCGAKLKNRLVNGGSRTGLWVLFWLALLGAPAFFFLTMPLDAMPAFWSLVIGAVVSGVILSLLFSRSVLAVIPWAIVFTIGVGVVYLGILFVGCLVLMTQKH